MCLTGKTVEVPKRFTKKPFARGDLVLMRVDGELFPRIEKHFEPCLLMYAHIGYAGNATFSIGAIP